MAKITTTIDGIHGTVKIVILDDDKKEVVDMRWCVFDEEEGSTGFVTSLSPTPIMVTELAAEQMLRLVLSGLIRSFEIKPGDLTIINHMGDSLPDVQFLPPTYKGNEADIISFVARQQGLLKLFQLYEEHGALDQGIIEIAECDGIVDDFLSLVQVRASGIFLAVQKPSQ